MTFKLALAALTWASAAALPSQASSAAAAGGKRISIQQLQSALSSDHSGINLHQLLHDSHGILRIALGADGDNNDAGQGFPQLRKRALSSLCDCPTFRPSILFEEALQSHPRDLQQIDLPDGTVRRTLASATVGFGDGEGKGESNHASVLELPSWVQDTCGHDAYDSFEDLRDVVSDAVDVFMERLDQEQNEGAGGKKDQSYRQILSGANHLEHFHVYTKSSTSLSGGTSQEEGLVHEIGKSPNSEREAVSTLVYHTDAGFFLAFVPAMNCHSYTTDNDSFYLKGRSEPLSFADDEVVIMMGAGAQYWLSSDEQNKLHPFLAASHALRLSPDTHRTWYGKMHILPSSFAASNVAPQLSSSPAPVKYGDVLPSFQLEGNKAHVPLSPVDGCGTTVFNENSLPSLSIDAVVEKQSRRRLQHVNSPENCNNQTNFFCWHQCINIPSPENAEEYVQDGYSLYCLDPAILVSTESIPEATDPCDGGYAHNSACKGTWHETDEKIPGYKLPYEIKEKQPDQSTSYTVPNLEEQYCYGGTSMYMDGFAWQGTTCVIYLFQSWVLTTPTKFALAALGSILFGIALEFVLWKRRSVYSLSPGMRRLCLSAFVYGIQLSMGYFIMLVIMTYSGPLFLCTVGGMMVGHMCFNAQDSLVKQWAEKKSRPDHDEVASANGGDGCLDRHDTSSNTELGSYQNGGNHGVLDSDELENGSCSASAKSPPESPAVSETSRLRSSIADGATPCCQYTL
ncbi:hypothetical protein ACHAXR_003372 [Thalassiosira sp. AJA248-18]